MSDPTASNSPLNPEDPWRKIVLDHALDAVIGMNEAQIIIDWNRQAEIIFGWTKEEATGRNLAETIIPQAFRQRHSEGLKKFLATGIGPILNRRIEIRALHRHGHDFPVELTVIPIRQGNHYIFYSFLRDITERANLDNARERYRNRLRLLSEATKDMIADPLSFESRLNQLMNHAVPTIGDWCVLEILEEDQKLKRFGTIHVDPDQEEALRTAPSLEPMLRVAHTGHPEIVSNQLLCVPLSARGKTLGAMALGIDRCDHAFNEDDFSLLQELAHRGAFAIDNARIFRTSVRNEERYRRLVETAQVIAWEADQRTGQFTYVSPQAKDILGYPIEEWYTHDFWPNHIHPDDRESTVQYCIESAARFSNYEFEYRMIAANGRIVWLRDIVSVSTSSDGKPILTGFMFDITDTKIYEELRSQSEEQLKQIVQSMPVMMDAFDENGLIVAWNAECERVTGYSAIEAIANPKIFEMLYPDATFRKNMLAEWKKRGNNYRGWEWDIRCKDGTTKTVSWSNISDEIKIRGWASWGVGVDVTDRKRTQVDLQEAVRARDEFLSIASHELKTPLTTLNLQVHMRARNLARGNATYSEEKLRSMIEMDLRQVERLTRLIDDILDVARINSGRLTMMPEALDVCSIVRETAERMETQFQQKSTPLSVDTCSGIRALWDQSRIEQVLSNLLGNALKYGQGKPVVIRVKSDKRTATIEVHDQGMGIASENQKRIFERFERAISKNEISGLGLGLYIVRQIVECHQGKIEVESELGNGATFRVTLPLSPNWRSKTRKVP